jgi:hypothetical protein
MEMTGGLQYHLVEASPQLLWDLNEMIMPIRQWWETTQIALSFETNIGHEFALLLCVNPSAETADIDVVHIDPNSKSNLEKSRERLKKTFPTKKRANAKLEILKEVLILASVGSLTVRGKKMFVIDMSVQGKDGPSGIVPIPSPD